MEYFISALVTAFFLIIYVVNHSKDREKFTRKLNDTEFCELIKKTSDNMSLPKMGTEKDYSVKKFKRTLIKSFITAKFQLFRQKSKYLEEFVLLLNDNKKFLKNIFKMDYSMLSDLPSVNNVARIEVIARLILEHNDYLIINDKIKTCLNLFNKNKTISYDEISSMNSALKFVLLEKMYYLSKRVLAFVKVENYSIKVAKHPERYTSSKFYQQVCKNSLVLHFIATNRAEECINASLVFYDVVPSITHTTAKIVDGLNILDGFDFLQFYSPIQILEEYEVFLSCKEHCKTAFLKELSLQATKLNIDEFAYAYAIKRYTNRAEPRYISSTQLNLYKNSVRIVSFQKDMRVLSRALISHFAMELYFGCKINKRFLKNAVLKNTYAPKVDISALKLGILLSNGKLTLNPVLPRNIKKISFDIVENKLSHHITIENSDTRELYCNGTKYEGIPAIKIGTKPLDIHLKVPPKISKE